MKHIVLALAILISLGTMAQELENVTVAGKDRTMMVYAPDNLSESRPLVISLHGAGQDAAYQRDQTKWNNCADTANFVVVYPNAINKFWDTSGQSDIVFLSAVIDMMFERYGIDLNRVYVTGFSLGGMMTYHCMEYMADKVAAFGPVSGVRFDNRAPHSTRRVPFIHTHGTGDDVFKWVGDPGHMAGGYPYIPDYVESWATYEGLTEKEVISPYPSSKPNSIATLTTWRSPDADDNIEVALLALKDKGHWHSEDLAAGVSTTQEIWKFCKRYTLQPEPPKILSAEPEDNSFDLENATHRSFIITFDNPAEMSSISAALIDSDNTSITLDYGEDATDRVIDFKIPDDVTISDGDYTLVISGIKNPEGGKEVTASINYTYGPSEAGNLIKEEFKALYDYAIELYESTDGATALSVVNARNRLKKYIDKYIDFSSTAPSAYDKASENLRKNFSILENYLESLGATSVISDCDVNDIQYFGVDGRAKDYSHPGVTIEVKRLSNGKSVINKYYR